MLRPVRALDTEPKKATRTALDTIEITPESVKEWLKPPFQRPLKMNAKVHALAEQIKLDGGVLPGVITIGVIAGEQYLLDGQHRREAFLLSGCSSGFVDICKHFFTDMAEMGREFVNLNSQLVRLKPDDILRGLEGMSEGLSTIRKQCSFVGYDMIRRSAYAPLLSMSVALRSWFGSENDVPGNPGSAMDLGARTTADEGEGVAAFLKMAHLAWGRDHEYARLWGSLNLTLCMWLYRRLVVTPYSVKTQKITKDIFTKCLMSLSADGTYLSWLHGRSLNERERTPGYNRVKAVFVRRLLEETGKKMLLPAPEWAHR